MADTTQHAPATGVLTDIVDLARLERATWPSMLHALRVSGVPLMADDGAGDGGDAAGAAGASGAAASGGADGAGDGSSSDGGDDAARLGDAGKKAIEAERTARREAEKALKDAQARLRAIEDKDKSDGEKLTVAEQRAQQAENRLARVQAAIKKKLPLDLADRLLGDTPEELERDAERLAKQLAPPNGGGFDQGARGGGQPQDMDALIRRAAGIP